jgi:8-oxo-dGTP pyrophosphatase MutT (NUDIX family)
MTDYVVVYAFTVEPGPRRIPMILKNKPEHLKGVLNLPGGKIEPGEDPINAAVRELLEETGLEELQEYDPMVYYPPEVVGRIYGHNCEIQLVTVPVCGRQELKPRASETEPVAWHDTTALFSHPNLMPNLRVAIPLVQAGYKGWEIVDRTGDFRRKLHTVELYLNTDTNVGWGPLQGAA